MGHHPADTLEHLGAYLGDMTQWRRHIHANPETAVEEVDTAEFVVQRLRGLALTKSTRASPPPAWSPSSGDGVKASARLRCAPTWTP